MGASWPTAPTAEKLGPQLVKGRDTPVVAYRMDRIDATHEGALT